MIGDVLLIKEEHFELAKRLLDFIPKHKKSKFLIAISGESASGKSVLSYSLSRLLKDNGILCKIIHGDDYYKVLPKERDANRIKNGIENSIGVDEYNWNKIYQNISDFKNGRQSQMPCVDLLTDQTDVLTTDFSEIDILIFEGLFAIASSNVDLRILLDINFFDNKFATDLRNKEKLNDFRIKVLEKESAEVKSLALKADLIINRKYEIKICNKEVK